MCGSTPCRGNPSVVPHGRGTAHLTPARPTPVQGLIRHHLGVCACASLPGWHHARQDLVSSGTALCIARGSDSDARKQCMILTISFPCGPCLVGVRGKRSVESGLLRWLVCAEDAGGGIQGRCRGDARGMGCCCGSSVLVPGCSWVGDSQILLMTGGATSSMWISPEHQSRY